MSAHVAGSAGVFSCDTSGNAKAFQALALPTAPLGVTTPVVSAEQVGKKRRSLEIQDAQHHVQAASKMRLKETLTGSSVNNRPPLAMKPPKAIPMFPTSAPFPMSPMPFGMLPTPMPTGPPLPAGMTWGVPAPPPALLMSMMSAMSGGFPNPMGFPFPMPPMAGAAGSSAVPMPNMVHPFLTHQMPFNPMMPTMLGSCLQTTPASGFIPNPMPEPTSCPQLTATHSQVSPSSPTTNTTTTTTTSHPSSGSGYTSTFTTSYSSAPSITGTAPEVLSGSPSSPQSVMTTAASGGNLPKSPLVVCLPTIEAPATIVSPSTADSSASDFFSFAKNTGGLMGLHSFDQLPSAEDLAEFNNEIVNMTSAAPNASPIPLPHLSPISPSGQTADVYGAGSSLAAALSPDGSSATPAADACSMGNFDFSAGGSPVADSGDSSFTDELSDFGVIGNLEDAALINMDCLFEDDLELDQAVDLSSLGLNLKKSGSFADLIGDSIWCNSAACSAS